MSGYYNLGVWILFPIGNTNLRTASKICKLREEGVDRDVGGVVVDPNAPHPRIYALPPCYSADAIYTSRLYDVKPCPIWVYP